MGYQSPFEGDEVTQAILNGLADYFEQIALGKVTDVSSVYKFGRNSLVGGTEEIIWNGGDEYFYPSSALAMELLSDNANDTVAGTGARVVRVFGLDENWLPQFEDVNTNGTTPVSLVNTYRRVFRAFVVSSGSPNSLTGANLGDVTIRTVAGANNQAIILTGEGQTLMAMYTVPAGYKALLWGVSATVGKRKHAYTKLKFRSCNSVDCPFTTKATRNLYQNAFTQKYKIPIVIEEMTDIVFTGENVDSGNIEVSAAFQIELIKIS